MLEPPSKLKMKNKTRWTKMRMRLAHVAMMKKKKIKKIKIQESLAIQIEAHQDKLISMLIPLYGAFVDLDVLPKRFMRTVAQEKIQMKKQIKQQEEKNVKGNEPAAPSSTPLPSYLLDRSNETNAKALSSAIKNKRQEKAAKFSVPLPKVRGIAEEEMFKVVKTGKKTAKKSWKRMITKPTFVGPDFTRRPVKYERFIRPMGLRYKKANVTHPELGVTVQLPIISVKKNPQNPMYTQLGVLTKGTIIEVNVSELGLVTAGGKVVWGRWAQITNNCENDGCVNA